MSAIYRNGIKYIGVTDAANMSIDVGQSTLNLESTVQNLIKDFATVETNPTSNSYSVGSFITFNGVLYKVKEPITVGDTLVIGTNVERTTVGELNTGALNSKDVVNNTTSTSTSLPLSAAQGKKLQDEITNLNGNAIKNITRSGTTFTATKVNGSTFSFTQQDNNTTYNTATTAANGLLKKLDASTAHYMRGDGSWATPPNTNTTYGTFTGATSAAAGASGLVLAPTKGQQGLFLRGDRAWAAPTNTTYGTFTGATSAAAGASGLVLAPTKGQQGLFLRGDRTWAKPTDTNTTYGTFTGATSAAAGAAGLVLAPTKGQQGLFLRGDRTWAKPTDTNTTYGTATTAQSGLMTASQVSKLNGISTGANNTHLMIEDYTSAKFNIAANSTYTITINAAKSGFTAIACAGWRNIGSSLFYPATLIVTTAGSVSALLKNTSSSALNGMQFLVRVLYYKNT